MRKSIFTAAVCVLILGIAAFGAFAGEEKAGEKTAFKAIHMVNLNSVADEAEFISILNELNDVIEELGYPEIRYIVWKEKGRGEGRYQYFFESTWPDIKTYQKIHEHEKYQKVRDKHKETYDKLLKDDVYNRYMPLN